MVDGDGGGGGGGGGADVVTGEADGAAFYDVEGREVAVFVVGAAGRAGVVDFEAWVVRMGV